MTEQQRALNLIWGARNIAPLIGKSERATFHLLEQRQIPGAFMIGRQHVLDVDEFKRKTAEQAA